MVAEKWVPINTRKDLDFTSDKLEVLANAYYSTIQAAGFLIEIANKAIDKVINRRYTNDENK